MVLITLVHELFSFLLNDLIKSYIVHFVTFFFQKEIKGKYSTNILLAIVNASHPLWSMPASSVQSIEIFIKNES